MPFISTVTTKTIDESAKEALTKEFGRAIASIKGKTEAWLMLKFEGNADMAFRGDSKNDCAMVSVDLFGDASPESTRAFTKEVCEILYTTLGVPADRIYVRYIGTDVWGYDGDNF